MVRTASECELIQWRFQPRRGGNSGGFQPIKPRSLSRAIPFDAGEIDSPGDTYGRRRVKMPMKESLPFRTSARRLRPNM